MHLIGRGRNAREAYPVAPRGGGVGAGAPFAQLGLSADVPFVDGAPTVLPFDEVVYQSTAFGGFEIESGNSLFYVPFGVYLVTLQADVDTTPTSLVGSITVASGSGLDAGSNGSTGIAVTVSMSAVRFGSETPSPGHVRPCAILPAVAVIGGGNGEIQADTTKLFVWQLQQFSVTP